ncbi:50S ribosomal protein L18 [Microgenomates bacterium UTCPR1]|nr:50S ribosomal protein L18 [Patescibacteria group bacterium]OQY67400.1 MAG: 50S ribosomal protein L18 [Microgenomates bacterium UTCPR1]
MHKVNIDKKIRKKRRVSSNFHGTEFRPRVVVFRSNRFIYAQAIDDDKRVTLASASSMKMKKSKKVEQAKEVGLNLAEILKKNKISEAVFDRSVYIYKGRIKSLAEGLRAGGIKV